MWQFLFLLSGIHFLSEPVHPSINFLPLRLVHGAGEIRAYHMVKARNNEPGPPSTGEPISFLAFEITHLYQSIAYHCN